MAPQCPFHLADSRRSADVFAWPTRSARPPRVLCRFERAVEPPPEPEAPRRHLLQARRGPRPVHRPEEAQELRPDRRVGLEGEPAELSREPARRAPRGHLQE